MFFNEWSLNLALYAETMQGDMPFLEFTVDPSGFELEDETPKSARLFQAPLAIDHTIISEDRMPKYKSVWRTIYHPDLIASYKNE